MHSASTWTLHYLWHDLRLSSLGVQRILMTRHLSQDWRNFRFRIILGSSHSLFGLRILLVSSERNWRTPERKEKYGSGVSDDRFNSSRKLREVEKQTSWGKILICHYDRRYV